MSSAALELGAAQETAADESGSAVEGGCAVCHNGNWIHVRYEYTEGDAVTDATFVVQTPNNGEPGGTVLAEGVVTVGANAEHEFVHVDLGSYNGPVEVFFFDDPTEPVPFEEPAPVEDERGWLRWAADAVMATGQAIGDGAAWVGDVAMGDFNEDMTTGQIITNAIVTAVPGIDQVADARDLIANGKYLIWDKRYNEIGVWVGVFACLIGLFPSLGSLAKGVIKIIWKNAGEMGRVLIYINRALHKTGIQINGYRFVKELGEGLAGKVGEVAAKFDEFLDYCAEKARSFGMDDTLRTIEEVRGMARQKFNEVATEISARISRGLAEYATKAFRLMPGQRVIVRRSIQLVNYFGPFPRIRPDMHRIGDTLDEGGVPRTPEHDLKLLEERDPRVIARKYSAIEADMPPEWRGKWTPEQWNDRALRNFDGPPRVVEVPPGTKLYRVAEGPGQANGSWWSFSPPPESEAAWRNRDAVRTDWNSGAAYVEVAAPPPSHVIAGAAGPKEAASNPDLIHTGGGEQLYVPNFNHPDPLFPDLDRQIAETGGWYYTPWNDRTPKQAVIPRVNAGRISECDL